MLRAQEDYLYLQPLIAQRLREQMPDLVAYGVQSMDQILATELRQPIAFVLWDGERFKDTSRAGGSTISSQRWAVMVAVANANQDAQDAPLHNEAGPLLAKAHAALAGWTPESIAGRSFKRVNGRSPIYSPNAGIYPLTFEIDINL
jgi:hypothetical protein